MRDVMSLVREVHHATDIIKDKSSLYKKSQSYLKFALMSFFPEEGNKTKL